MTRRRLSQNICDPTCSIKSTKRNYKEIIFSRFKEFKILLLTYKTLSDQTPSYLKDLIVPSRALCSLLLVLPKIPQEAFSCQAPFLHNQVVMQTLFFNVNLKYFIL